MAKGSDDLQPKALREMTDEVLTQKLAESKKELFKLRFQSATGQLESSARLRSVRTDIARIYTEMRERELNIGRDEKVG